MSFKGQLIERSFLRFKNALKMSLTNRKLFFLNMWKFKFIFTVKLINHQIIFDLRKLHNSLCN